MNLVNPYRFSSATSDTTADGKQVWMLIGDSKSAGQSPGFGPTPAANTVFQWDRTGSVVTVGSSDILYCNGGSQWPSFGIEYYNLTGKKPVFVSNGRGGSRFFNAAGGTTSWYTNGTLYSDAVTRTNACLASLNLTKIAGVIITLGVNDNDGSDIQTYLNSLIDRINTDFDTPKIYMSISSQGGSIGNLGPGFIKRRQWQSKFTYSNVHITVNEDLLFLNGLTSDNTHFSLSGNDFFGKLTARYIASSQSDKDIRRVLTCNFLDDLTVAQQNAFSSFITSQKSAGNWDKINCLQFYKGSTARNALVDLAGIQNGLSVGATFTTDSNYSTNGSTSYIDTGFNPNSIRLNYSADDFLSGVGLGTNSTSVGTLATLFGVISTSGREYITQLASSTIGWASNLHTGGEINYASDTSIQSNTDYAVRKSASNSISLMKAGVAVQSTSPATSGIPNSKFYLGAKSSTNTAQEFIACEYKYFLYTQNTGFNYSSFLTDIQTLYSAW